MALTPMRSMLRSITIGMGIGLVSAVWAGVLSGMAIGAAIAFVLALRWLTAWENAHGREVLQDRGRAWRKQRISVRELGSGRFERGLRERELEPSR